MGPGPVKEPVGQVPGSDPGAVRGGRKMLQIRIDSG